MTECNWCKDEICVNADCPICCDYCPVPDTEGVCKFEDRSERHFTVVEGRMKEYITKDRAKQFVCGHCNEVCSEKPCEPRDCDWMAFIDKEPAADVAPVVHGRWIEQEKYTFGVMYDCSICDNRILDNGHSWNYCPNCGAIMDVEEL